MVTTATRLPPAHGRHPDLARVHRARPGRCLASCGPRLWLVLAAAALGCGRHPARLSGEVTLDGRPLTNGVIMLTPARTGPSAYGEIRPDGRYELKTGSEKGLEPGEYVVTVAANELGPVDSDSESGAAPAIQPLMTPPRYADVGTSPLRITVKPGRQTFEIDLTSTPQTEAAAPGSEP